MCARLRARLSCFLHLAIFHFELDFLLLGGYGLYGSHKPIRDDRDTKEEEEHNEEVDDGAEDLLTQVTADILGLPRRNNDALLASDVFFL